MNKLVDDTQCIAEWKRLLKVFHLLIENNPKPEDIKQDLLALKEAAKTSAHLTFHQVSAIAARCDNYLSGEYGNTKTAENISQVHNFSSNGKASKNGTESSNSTH